MTKIGNLLNTVTNGFVFGAGFTLGALMVLWWMGRLH